MGKIFGTSGIRGISNKDLTPELAIKVGLAAVTESGKGEVLLAHDTRTTSQMFLNAIIAGLLSCGADAKILGLATTPCLAYLTKALNAKFGVMLTASHNPPEYNGIKLFDNEGIAYDEVRENRIEDIIFSERFSVRARWDEIGHTRQCEYEVEKYIELISNAVSFKKEWRLAVDFGNGASCKIAPEIFDRVGVDFVSINAQPDGFFPGRSPEPNEDSLKELSSVVEELGLDAGVAYDGDADRMAIIDEGGNFLSMDKALAAYAAHLVEKNKGTVVVPIDTSICVDEAVLEKGGKIIRTGIGDVKVAEATKKHKAIFGGEVSGAWVNQKFHLCPDGVLSSMLFLKAVEEVGKTVSSLVSEIHSYPILRTKVNCPNELKYKIMKELGEKIKGKFADIKEILTIDGVRVSTDEGWLLIRPSGTEPIIRIVSEAKTMKASRKYLKIGEAIIKEILKGN